MPCLYETNENDVSVSQDDFQIFEPGLVPTAAPAVLLPRPVDDQAGERKGHHGDEEGGKVAQQSCDVRHS